jgi:hypothetical protein
MEESANPRWPIGLTNAFLDSTADRFVPNAIIWLDRALNRVAD